MDENQLFILKRRFNNLKSNLLQIVNQLNYAIDSLKQASSKIGSCYLIDNVPADKGKINEIMLELMTKRNVINNNVIPGINAEIDKINKQLMA